jgi:protein involved in polysaccharide export with SLBB domain
MLLLLGMILVGLGVFYFKSGPLFNSSKIELINEPTVSQSINSEIVVEIAGAVEKDGVYKLSDGARVEDLLIASGGLSQDADREWIEKTLNRAAKLTDVKKYL